MRTQDHDRCLAAFHFVQSSIRYWQRRCPRSADEVFDVAQLAVVYALHKRPDIPFMFVRRYVNCRIMDMLRHRNHQKRCMSRERAILFDFAATAPCYDQVQIVDTWDEIEVALRPLPVESRRILILRFMEGYTFRELRKLLNRSISILHNHCRQALQALRSVA
jgi:DNA-directed RNA polymerase specialized sigma24 family protein